MEVFFSSASRSPPEGAGGDGPAARQPADRREGQLRKRRPDAQPGGGRRPERPAAPGGRGLHPPRELQPAQHGEPGYVEASGAAATPSKRRSIHLSSFMFFFFFFQWNSLILARVLTEAFLLDQVSARPL